MNLCIPIIFPETKIWVCKICGFTDNYSGKKIVKKCSKSCEYLGEQNGQITCKSCKGNYGIKLFICKVHKQCTIGKQVDDIICCQTCEDYKPK